MFLLYILIYNSISFFFLSFKTTFPENTIEIIITTKNDKTVVVISLDEYNQTHAKLRRDVIEAKKQIEQDDFVSIDEAFEKAKRSYRA